MTATLDAIFGGACPHRQGSDIATDSCVTAPDADVSAHVGGDGGKGGVSGARDGASCGERGPIATVAKVAA